MSKKREDVVVDCLDYGMSLEEAREAADEAGCGNQVDLANARLLKAVLRSLFRQAPPRTTIYLRRK